MKFDFDKAQLPENYSDVNPWLAQRNLVDDKVINWEKIDNFVLKLIESQEYLFIILAQFCVKFPNI